MAKLDDLQRAVHEAEVDLLRADEAVGTAYSGMKQRWSQRLPWVAGAGAAGLVAALALRSRPSRHAPQAADLRRAQRAARAHGFPEFAAPLLHLLVRRISGMALLAAAGASAKKPHKPLATVPHVDLARYAGMWFEVARLPLAAEAKCERDVTAHYEVQGDVIRVTNRCRRANGRLATAVGRARVADPRTPARLQVSFAPALLDAVPLVWSDYWILELTDDYSAAMVGTPDRKHLWLLARTPSLPGTVLSTFIARAEQQGFDTKRLAMTEHRIRQAPAAPENAAPLPRAAE